jgi:ubiquinone/menaquinone biosynthesis C-methylase UbiE
MIEPVSTDAGWVGLIDAMRLGWYNQERLELAPGFSISSDDIVVDVGAGAGGMAQFCARQGARTVLVEPDPAVVTRTVADLKAQGAESVEGVVGDVASLPLPDAFASRIICAEVLEHVDDPVLAISELVRIGRPGARYLITAPAPVSERLQQNVAPQFYFEKPHHIRVFEEGELARLAQSAGLTIESQGALGFYWTIWWLFYWKSGYELGSTSHPLLDAWARTWGLLLAVDGGEHVKAALDALAPKTVAIVARKPL